VSTATQAAAPAPAAKTRKSKHIGPAKLFVLDTNVLLHDPMCLFRFEEHDIFLPMIVLEELDGHKKGMTEVARNARQTSRTLDALAGHHGRDITAGLPLSATGHRTAGGKLFFQTQLLSYTLPTSLPQGKADNQILGVVETLRQQHTPREVVLVSKDINMRVKARALARFLDYPWQYGRELAAGRQYFLPHHRPRRAPIADQPVCLLRGAGRAKPLCQSD
jgi:PhoH-like ATPase